MGLRVWGPTELTTVHAVQSQVQLTVDTVAGGGRRPTVLLGEAQRAGRPQGPFCRVDFVQRDGKLI